MSLKKLSLLTFSILVGTLLLSLPVFAGTEKEYKPLDVYVPLAQVVDGNIFRVARSVNIDGKVKGDVIVVAETVNIDGIIEGDLIAFAKYITIKGVVAGDVRIAAESVLVSGDIGNNANIFAKKADIKNTGRIFGYALVKSFEFNHQGLIAGNLEGMIADFNFSGGVRGNVDVTVKNMEVSPHARVAGSFVYKSPTNFEILEQVAGGRVTSEVMTGDKFPEFDSNYKFKGLLSGIYLLFLFVELMGLLIIAYIFLKAFPKKALEINKIMSKTPWKALGVGVAGYIAFPFLIIILVGTLVGVPLAIVLVCLLMVAIILSKVMAGLVIGRWILEYKKGFFKRKKVSLMKSAILGIFIYIAFLAIPIIGIMVCFLLTAWAFGAMLIYDKKHYMKGWF